MPFARVGAMPPPNDDQQGASRARPNRQKGITMEDLKKQTALRLAHEQHHGQSVPGSAHSTPIIPPSQPVDSKGRPIVTPETLAARSHSTSSFSSREPLAPPYQRLNHHHTPSGHQHLRVPDSSLALAAFSTGRYYDSGSKHAKKKGLRPPSSVSVPAAPHAPVAMQPGGGGYYQDQRAQYLRSASVPTLPPVNPVPAAPGYDTASSNQGGLQSSSTSKLPHGLTVHELKEMTKARLQAEASDKPPTDRPASTTASMTERDSQQDSRSITPANYAQQMNSQDFHLVGNGADSISPHPADLSGRQPPPQVSPPPAAFQPFYPPTSSFNNNVHRDSNIVMGNRNRIHSCPDTSWDSRAVGVGNRDRLDSFPEVIGNRQRLDSFPDMSGHRTRIESFRDFSGNRTRLDSFPDSHLECASVTSHNSTVASDYLGSESAYSSGAGGFSQGNEDRSFVPVQRTQSFPTGNGSPQEYGPSSMSPQGNYYESSAGLAQNRGRSLTLSPRPGLSLLHEDRPGFYEEDIGIPSFSSSRHVRQQPGPRSRISPVLHPQGHPSDNFSGIASSATGGSLGSYGDNRPRASSAASLPAMSHTAEEFAVDYPGTSRQSSENFYGSSSLYSNGSDATGEASSVFRERLTTLPAPPGLSRPSDTNFQSGSDMNPLSSRMGSGVDSLGGNRARAATWNPGSDMFGSGSGLYECSGDDTLAGDLASILKLSGAEERADNNGRSGMFRDVPDSSFLGGSNEFKENDSRSQRF